MQRSIMIAMMMLLATPAVAELRIPCLWNPFGGCSVKLVSPEYAARPVEPLDPEAALAAINAFRAENGLKPLALDARLIQAATMQSEIQAGRGRIGHYGSDGSTPMQRAERSGYHAKLPPRMSHRDKNRSATRCAFGSKVPGIGPTCCVRT